MAVPPLPTFGLTASPLRCSLTVSASQLRKRVLIHCHLRSFWYEGGCGLPQRSDLLYSSDAAPRQEVGVAFAVMWWFSDCSLAVWWTCIGWLSLMSSLRNKVGNLHSSACVSSLAVSRCIACGIARSAYPSFGALKGTDPHRLACDLVTPITKPSAHSKSTSRHTARLRKNDTR